MPHRVLACASPPVCVCVLSRGYRMASFTAIQERLEDIRVVSAGIISLVKLSLCTILVINALGGAWHYIGRHSPDGDNSWLKHYCPYVHP